MKKFLAVTLEMKKNICLFFTGGVLISMLINLFTGTTQLSSNLLWQIMLTCIVGVVLQMVAFSELIIKKIKPIWRAVIFAVPFLAFLSGCAIWFQWFPIDVFGYWITFCVIFFVVFIIISIVYEIYYRITGENFNKGLEDYKKKNG